MDKLKNLTAEQIRKMSYNELIGITRETNRTPGGTTTIRRIAQLAMLNSNSNILDIGTSTGHTSIEFSRLLDCKVTGIDINEISIETAKARADLAGLKKTNFLQDDATCLKFEDNTFDLVFCGNVTSLVNDPKKALNEYWRVVKNTGYIAAIPMYYVKTPSEDLVNNVRDAIQVNISVQYKEDWVKFYLSDDVDIFASEDYVFDKISEENVRKFCRDILRREHLNVLSENAKEALEECYEKYMLLFRENLSHMGFSILLLRKKESDVFNDPELFTSRLA